MTDDFPVSNQVILANAIKHKEDNFLNMQAIPADVQACGLAIGYTQDGILAIIMRNDDNEVYATCMISPIALETMLEALPAWRDRKFYQEEDKA
jgi:hypothetical protein